MEQLPSLLYGEDCIRAYAPLAAADSTRPKYHFASPAGNLLDTWGAFYHRGYYHLFYDINADGSADRYAGYFGHIRSRDLISWEQLPLALAPEAELGELQLNDGCITLDGGGNPLMWYTRVFYDGRAREHVAVAGDGDMLTWHRIPDVAPITMDNHGGPIFENEWSDPIIFRDGGRAFMLISKCITKEGRRGVIPIYEAKDDRLLSWRYRGIFLDETGEVLNFIKIGEKWVMIHSPYSDPVWIVGDFDTEACRFHPEVRGVLSRGYKSQGIVRSRGDWRQVSRGFYATTTMTDPAGDTLIFGWVSGFDAPEPTEWMGAVALPRRLALDEENRVCMLPARAVDTLFSSGMPLEAGAEYPCPEAFLLELALRDMDDGELTVQIGDVSLSVSRREIRLRDITVPAEESGMPERLSLYVDVSIAELFINGGRSSITRCIPALSGGGMLRIDTTGAVSFTGCLRTVRPLH